MSSAKVSPFLLGADGGEIEGGRSNALRSNPGKTSEEVEKNWAKPREK
jgi:hypothetical protein